MLILPGALPVSPSPEQAFAVRIAPPKTNTVEAPTGASDAKNQSNLGAGSQGNQSHAILKPPPDPNRPAGPAPAFDANLLEVEREKAKHTDIKPEPETKTAHTETGYEPPDISTEREVDIAV